MSCIGRGILVLFKQYGQCKICLFTSDQKESACQDKKKWEQEKRWQAYEEELYKKDLHDPDNHDGVITHLEPDILESEVKWALGSITMNKASGGDGIPVQLFQIPEADAVKVLHSICQKTWKTQQWPQDWGKISFHSNSKERQCQRMFKLPHSCTHLTYQ